MPKQMVTIEAAPGSRIAYIKCLRQVTGLGLKSAAELADYPVPFDLVVGVDPDVAEHIASVLNTAGATVQVQDSPLASPMLISPHVNRKYVKHWFKGYAPAP